LWDSWQPDAVVADRESGIYAHPQKIAEVNFDGKYFRCRARYFVSPSPQGRPVLWQAGSSDQGRRFAAETAEAIYAIHPTVGSMRDYSTDIRRRVAAADRDPNSVKLFYGVQPIVGRTASEAAEKAHYLASPLRPEASLAMLSGQLGVDFSHFDPATRSPHRSYPRQPTRPSAAACGSSSHRNRAAHTRRCALRVGHRQSRQPAHRPHRRPRPTPALLRHRRRAEDPRPTAWINRPAQNTTQETATTAA
jgi:alkanesulfonate monooxygenase SsuD/methylene tetrahydromethanopterin reductase-like flavin-dependent oxidoreductase (luciferase family)